MKGHIYQGNNWSMLPGKPFLVFVATLLGCQVDYRDRWVDSGTACSDVDVDADTDTDTDTDVDADTDGDGDTDSSSDLDTDSMSDTDPDTGSDTNTDPEELGTCAAPFSIAPVSGSTAGSSFAGGDDGNGSCGGMDGQDEVYRFVLAEPMYVRFHMAGYDTVLYIRTGCLDPNSEIACNDDFYIDIEDDDDDSSWETIEDETLDFSDDDDESNDWDDETEAKLGLPLDVGVYYLWADSYDGADDYELHYTFIHSPCRENACPDDKICLPVGDWTDFECNCPEGKLPFEGECLDNPCLPNPCDQPNKSDCQPVLPESYECQCDNGFVPDLNQPDSCVPIPGRDCTNPMVIAPRDGKIDDTTSGMGDSAQGECGGENAGDRVYQFELKEQTRVTFEMTGFDTVLYLRAQCDDPGSEIDCNDDYDDGLESRLNAVLEPGRYYLWVDGYDTEGEYGLTYLFRPNPCKENSCPETFECQPQADWQDYKCICPEGMVSIDDQCVVDRCNPNPCVDVEHKKRCVQTPNDAYICECGLGYTDDGTGGCVADPEAAEWAILIVMNGDNEMAAFVLDDLYELSLAGAGDEVQITVMLDTIDSTTEVNVATPTGLQQLADWGEENLGDWQTLRDFAVWSAENTQARHYALLFVDHQMLWSGELPLIGGFSFDETNETRLSIANGDYSKILASIRSTIGRKLDVVGFDVSLLGMWEMVEATAPYADYLVASEHSIPEEGWPYDRFCPPSWKTVQPHQRNCRRRLSILIFANPPIILHLRCMI